MAKYGVIRRFFGSLVNIRKWIAYDQIKTNNIYLIQIIKNLYSTDRGVSFKTETFSDAVQRLQLSENDIKNRTQCFLYYSLFYLLVAICLFGYTIYLFMINAAIFAVMGCLVLALLMWIYSFREHFWYMQMKKRKLGCTIKEWFAFVLGRTK